MIDGGGMSNLEIYESTEWWFLGDVIVPEPGSEIIAQVNVDGEERHIYIKVEKDQCLDHVKKWKYAKTSC